MPLPKQNTGNVTDETAQLIREVIEENEEASGDPIEGQLVNEAKTEGHPDEEAKTELAPQGEAGTQMKAAANTSAAITSPTDFLATLGFTDLKIDFTSFPIIKLDDGKFQTSDVDDLGTELKVQIISERSQFVYVASDPAKGRDAENIVIYSDDGVRKNSDDPAEAETMADIVADWESKKYVWDRKKYVVALCRMIDNMLGLLVDEVVQIQVPPRSIAKYDGYKVTCAMKRPPVDFRNTVCTVSVGKKVGTGTKAFNPMNFTFAYLLED